MIHKDIVKDFDFSYVKVFNEIGLRPMSQW